MTDTPDNAPRSSKTVADQLTELRVMAAGIAGVADEADDHPEAKLLRWAAGEIERLHRSDETGAVPRNSYVTFEKSGAVTVDLAAYLQSPEGKAQLDALTSANGGE